MRLSTRYGKRRPTRQRSSSRLLCFAWHTNSFIDAGTEPCFLWMQNKTTNLERLKDTQTYKHTYVSVYARIKSKRINLFFGAQAKANRAATWQQRSNHPSNWYSRGSVERSLSFTASSLNRFRMFERECYPPCAYKISHRLGQKFCLLLTRRRRVKQTIFCTFAEGFVLIAVCYACDVLQPENITRIHTCTLLRLFLASNETLAWCVELEDRVQAKFRISFIPTLHARHDRNKKTPLADKQFHSGKRLSRKTNSGRRPLNRYAIM